jgi:hypothetical protein
LSPRIDCAQTLNTWKVTEFWELILRWPWWKRHPIRYWVGILLSVSWVNSLSWLTHGFWGLPCAVHWQRNII